MHGRNDSCVLQSCGNETHRDDLPFGQVLKLLHGNKFRVLLLYGGEDKHTFKNIRNLNAFTQLTIVRPNEKLRPFLP